MILVNCIQQHFTCISVRHFYKQFFLIKFNTTFLWQLVSCKTLQYKKYHVPVRDIFYHQCGTRVISMYYLLYVNLKLVLAVHSIRFHGSLSITKIFIQGQKWNLIICSSKIHMSKHIMGIADVVRQNRVCGVHGGRAMVQWRENRVGNRRATGRVE